MERFIQHLEQLIIQHDYAILPEFGGFIVNYVPARIDSSKAKISAPCKEICFNPALNYNDGLLAGMVQRTENITFRKANLIVREDIEDLKKRLKNGETVTLGKIGSLRLDENSQTEFLPAASYDFLPDNIGNYDVRCGVPKAGKEETREIVLQIPSGKHQIYKYAAAIGIILALAILTPILHPHFSPYLAKLNPLALFAPDSLPSFDSLPKRYTQTDSAKAATKDSSAIDSTKQVATNPRCTAPWHVIAGSFPTKTQAIDKAHDLQKQIPGNKMAVAYSSTLRKSTVPAIAPSASATTASSTASWHVIVGNFETVKKAKIFVADMERLHKIKLSIYGTNSVYRIVAASYKTAKEAAIKLAEVKKISDFQGAWLLRNASLLAHAVQNGQAPQPTVKAKTAATAATPQQTNATLFNPSLWYVIIANYCSPKQAQEYANTAGKKESVTLGVVKDKKLYRVIAGSYKTKEAAAAKIKELHKHVAFAEAWVLYKPNFK